MRVKCKSDTVTVFPYSGGHYLRTIDEVTKGNVYEVISEVRRDYYEILPDEGFQTIELPDYMFKPTEEPITVNKDREKNEKERQARLEAVREAELTRQRQQEISDNLDAFYNPSLYHKKQAAKARRIKAISEVFVQGISYG